MKGVGPSPFSSSTAPSPPPPPPRPPHRSDLLCLRSPRAKYNAATIDYLICCGCYVFICFFLCCCSCYCCFVFCYLLLLSFLFRNSLEDVPLVEFMYLVFTRMPGESYRRRLRSVVVFVLLISSACVVC